MTEPRVEAGDRALETARKFIEARLCPPFLHGDEKHQDWLREETRKWIEPLAALIQSAMNAQERELNLLLPDSLNRPMSERIQGLKARADREANLAVELREALSKAARNLYETSEILRDLGSTFADAVFDSSQDALFVAERGEGI